VPSVSKLSLGLALGAIVIGNATAIAQGPGHDQGHEQGHERGGEPHPGPARGGESHPGPHGYDRVTEPHGWDARPKTVDRVAYQHNFQAARTFRIGPYHRPGGWAPHHWVYGQILPRVYWGPSYLISDYWLFALEVPPTGYEWVRDDSDALLISTDTGEILQVEYGVFG
jgi:Ni/Co efflux regulator RcnB